jgi:hypothetical protein
MVRLPSGVSRLKLPLEANVAPEMPLVSFDWSLAPSPATHYGTEVRDKYLRSRYMPPVQKSYVASKLCDGGIARVREELYVDAGSGQVVHDFEEKRAELGLEVIAGKLSIRASAML